MIEKKIFITIKEGQAQIQVGANISSLELMACINATMHVCIEMAVKEKHISDGGIIKPKGLVHANG